MTGFTINQSISALTVFLQGILSFFSPCVLPLLPVYIGYLAGGTAKKDDRGETVYDRKTFALNTVFFVLGIGFAFFVLGLGMRAVGRFFSGNRLLFARIGGAIVILFGLYQLGLLGSLPFMNREKRLHVRFDKWAMSRLTAFLMGFFFSFAWTPCVGPTLSSVLLMAASANGSAQGFGLIGLYTLGFVIPFLATGLFATTMLSFFRQHKNVLRCTAKAGGVLMVIMGLLMVTGQMNTVSSSLSAQDSMGLREMIFTSASAEGEQEQDDDFYPAPDFTLTDQFGNVHTLSDYKGKIVFLNFWMTWCPPCWPPSCWADSPAVSSP